MSSVNSRSTFQAPSGRKLPTHSMNRKNSRRNVQHRSRMKKREFEKQTIMERKFHYGQSTAHSKYVEENPRSSDQGSHANTNRDTERKERKTRKVYRKKKVLRAWVLPAFFFVPLGIICLEYYIDKLIGLEDIRGVYQEQLFDPWNLLLEDLNTSRIQEVGQIPSLPKLSFAPRLDCPPGQRRMINVHNPLSHSIGSGGRLIPMIVHQQSKTRCLTMKVDRAVIKWATLPFRRWSYYMHDEYSRNRLLNTYCGDSGIPKCEFPLLRQIVNKCFYNETKTQNQLRHYFLKIELWKFLILWIYGGVYAELDFLPGKFTPETIEKDDAFLLIDSKTQMLSTKLIAISPRHPIMYFAVQQILLIILTDESSLTPVGATTVGQKGTMKDKESAGKINGSSVLSQAFRFFREGFEMKGESGNFSPGIFHGVMNRTVRVVATGRYGSVTRDVSDNKISDLAVSIFGTEKEKEMEFRKMGVPMDSWEDSTYSDAENYEALSCLDKLYHFS